LNKKVGEHYETSLIKQSFHEKIVQLLHSYNVYKGKKKLQHVQNENVTYVKKNKISRKSKMTDEPGKK
jgi:hypothetical protein